MGWSLAPGRAARAEWVAGAGKQSAWSVAEADSGVGSAVHSQTRTGDVGRLRAGHEGYYYSAATSSTEPKRSSAVLAFWGVAQAPSAGFKSVSIGPG